MVVVLMGVSGSGKTTIGNLLAQKTGLVFADADDYHPESNKQKMASGQPLNDDDRQPWLETLNGVLRGWYESGKGGVLACSALKAKYRDTLASGMPEGAVHFVWLDGSREMIEKRMQSRQNHYMKAGMLESQLAALEPPADALRVTNDHSPDQVVNEILQHISQKTEK